MGRISTDRETIRAWADEHGAIPVRHTGEGASDESAEYHIVREADIGESHERVDWDDFFGGLDEGDHVVVYRETDAAEPFEVTRREKALTRRGLTEAELEERLIEGESVTSEVRETTVVESVVVEEATIESELVDTEVVDQEVLDVELVERECTDCRLVEEPEQEAGRRDWFDEDRYIGSIDRAGGARGTAETEPARQGSGADADRADTGTAASTSAAESAETDRAEMHEEVQGAIEGADVPYSATLDVEEVWSVTRGFVERFTVESRVADTEVAETDIVEDRDIDIEGLHRSIATSDLIKVEPGPQELLDESEIQTEFAEDDRIRTQFDRERIVEEEVIDRKRLQADVTGGDLLAMEVVSTQDVATETTGPTGPTDEPGTEAAAMESASGDTEGVEPGERPGSVSLTDDDIGKMVVDATGEEIGMVATVEENGEVMRVDAHPGITDRIKAALEWGDVGDDDYPVESDQVERVTDDQVELKGADEMDESGHAG